jgi:SAM-dependent methyltransferase
VRAEAWVVSLFYPLPGIQVSIIIEIEHVAGTDKTNYTYSDYDECPDPSHRHMYFSSMMKHFKARPDIRNILDAGCGGGDFAEGLAKEGFNVYGLDLSTSGIKAAQARGIGTFVVSSVYDDLTAPFGLSAFDAIVSIETIEHLYSPKTFVSCAKAALRPKGLLIVTAPYWGYLKNIVLAMTDRIDKALAALWEGGHIKHFSRATLTKLVVEQGFDEIAFEGCGEGIRAWVPYLWNGMLMVFQNQ